MATKQGKYIHTIKDAALPMEDYINSLRNRFGESNQVSDMLHSISRSQLEEEYAQLLFLVSTFLRSGPYILSPEY